ncbi:uncharacterized protein LOC126770407 [Nymphalis io]|uniref:uncharacterized protein LOC126770407 n=1 Tax=Inachis io TaxID=171585 RepID=UPI002168AFD9|nr:uncharacterized protein LOC126770407 [Nymphalis io]
MTFWDKARSLLDTGNRVDEPFSRVKEDGKRTVTQGKATYEKKSKTSFWKKLCDTKSEDFDLFDNGPDRIEVYRFEKANEFLCARDATSITHVERAARYLRRPATALLSELLAVPRVLIGVPVAIVLQIERCLLSGARSIMTGALQAASDQLLKPTLALAFNAIVQPPLVFATQTASALRGVVRPLTLALTDVLEPFTHLVSSLRLVHIERRCSCTQQV